MTYTVLREKQILFQRLQNITLQYRHFFIRIYMIRQQSKINFDGGFQIRFVSFHAAILKL